MLLSPSVDELDQLVTQYPLNNDRARLLLAIMATFVAHIFVLAFWKIDVSEVELFPTLSVSLIPVEKMIIETVTPQVKPMTESQQPAHELNPDEMRNTVMDKMQASRVRDGFTLYTRAIEIIREGSLPAESDGKKKYRTFSTRDFPKIQENNPYERVQYLPLLISQAQTFESKDQLGYYTIKRTDGFGKTVCYQQRGFPGDGNPPLWYRIPASTCGHIK